MKKNCICLSCENLDREMIPKGILKCDLEYDTDVVIQGELLNGETDKCPYNFYVKKKDETWNFDNQVSVVPYYAYPPPDLQPQPSYDCITCSHCVDRKCDAFPEGIPCGFIFIHGHKEKLPGQNNDIVYDWKNENDLL